MAWALLGCMLGARAEAQAEPAAPPAPAGGDGEPSRHLEEAPPEPGDSGLRLSGRVLARATADERTQYQNDFRLQSARLGLHARYLNLDAVVEADFASSAPLKDAFLRLADDGRTFRLYAGRFKPPFLQRALWSSWELPLVGRGLVEDFLVGDHHLGGRRLGLMAEAKLRGVARGARLQLGLFRGEPGASPDLERGEDAAARAQVKLLRGFTLGASSYAGEVTRGVRRLGAGVDAELRRGGWLFSLEAVGGRVEPGRFAGALALVGYQLPLGAAGRWTLQPVAFAEGLVLRADGEEALRHGTSAGAAVNLGFAGRFKAQAQVERAFRPGDLAPRTEVAIQLGARL